MTDDPDVRRPVGSAEARPDEALIDALIAKRMAERATQSMSDLKARAEKAEGERDHFKWWTERYQDALALQEESGAFVFVEQRKCTEEQRARAEKAEAKLALAEAALRHISGRSDAENVREDLSDWDHADVYRGLSDSIEEARAYLAGGAPCIG